MWSYIVRRLWTSIFVVLGVLTLVFVAVRAAPGDPVSAILGEQAVEVDKSQMRACMGLVDLETIEVDADADHRQLVRRRFGPDAQIASKEVATRSDGNPTAYELAVETPVSLVEQYIRYVGDVANGTFGELCNTPGVTVMDRLLSNLPSTAELAFAALLTAMLIGLPLGVLAALRPYSWIDNFSIILALLGISIPNFWLGPMLLILFSLTLKVLPDPGAGVSGLSALVLPAVTLGTAMAAKLMRMMRSSMLEQLSLDYVRTAKAKGASPWRVVVHHVIRNALIPIITVLGLQFGALLTGAIIVEKIFARPGIGTLLLDGINSRNYMVVQGCVIFISLSYVLVNLVTDLLYALVDPRIRYD